MVTFSTSIARVATALVVATVAACGAIEETTRSGSVDPVVSDDTEPASEAVSVAPCDDAAILDVVDDAFPDLRVPIVAVSVEECANGYARVFAIPDDSTCNPGSVDSECFENEQVFLIDRGGSWEVLAYGTGIECANEPMLTPDLAAACQALGLLPPDGAGQTQPSSE